MKTFNFRLYLCMTLIAMIIIILSFIVPKFHRLDEIVVSVGCGIFTSVCVAGLIEYNNIKQHNDYVKKLEEGLFQQFDLSIQYQLGVLLFEIARNNNDFNVEIKYNIPEILDNVERCDGNRPIWRNQFHNIGEAFSLIDPGLIPLINPTESNVELYNIINNQQRNFKTSEYILENYTLQSEKNESFEFAQLKTALMMIDGIYKLRKMNPSIGLDANQKELLENYKICQRNSVK